MESHERRSFGDPAIGPEVIAHYVDANKQERLATEHGPLELARTQELLLRQLPDPPALVLDVGGRPGRYASWLAMLAARFTSSTRYSFMSIKPGRCHRRNPTIR